MRTAMLLLLTYLLTTLHTDPAACDGTNDFRLRYKTKAKDVTFKAEANDLKIVLKDSLKYN